MRVILARKGDLRIVLAGPEVTRAKIEQLEHLIIELADKLGATEILYEEGTASTPCP